VKFVQIALVIGLALVGIVRAQEIISTTQMERQIFDWTNQERAKIKAPPLKWNDRLAIAARLHSDEMAQQKDLSHQLKDEPVFTERLAAQGAHFNSAAENVGYGDDAESLHDGWMHSPPHRANLLNPAYTDMGIGIVRVGDRLWATEDFATVLQKFSSEDFEKSLEQQIASLRSGHGLPPLKANASLELRRIACSGNASPSAAMGAAPRGASQSYAFNFTAPSPEQLPTTLANRVLELSGGSYSLGACPTQPNGQGMTTYRVLMVFAR